MCRVRGEFQLAPNVDEQLQLQPVKCPYVRARTGVECQWVGPYGDMSTHIHRFPEPPRRMADDRKD